MGVVRYLVIKKGKFCPSHIPHCLASLDVGKEMIISLL